NDCHGENARGFGKGVGLPIGSRARPYPTAVIQRGAAGHHGTEVCKAGGRRIEKVVRGCLAGHVVSAKVGYRESATIVERCAGSACNREITARPANANVAA